MPASAPPHLAEHGRDAGRGNLLGIQPWLTQHDYASEAALTEALKRSFSAAARRGWLNPRTIAVLPEYLGTWLAIAGEGGAVRRVGSLNAAMQALALRHPLRFAAAWRHAPERDRLAGGLFHLQAERMARAYTAIFAELARRYGVTVVAGSILLPGARVEDGVVVPGDGPVQNISVVFGPNGRALSPLVRKVIPTEAESPFCASAPVEGLPVFDTPAGRLGVLICADSWLPEAYAVLKWQGAQLVAVPSAVLGEALWDQPWRGYNGMSPPADVDPADVGRLTEGQAWHKYALPGRLAASGARAGVNAFLRGQFWDQLTGGYSLGVANGRLVLEAAVDGPALVNLWLD